jgi:hypothetical protein
MLEYCPAVLRSIRQRQKALISSALETAKLRGQWLALLRLVSQALAWPVQDSVVA